MTAPHPYADLPASRELRLNTQDPSGRIPYRYSAYVDWKTYRNVILRDIERSLDVVGASQLVIAAALIGFMIFRRQGLVGTREFRPSLLIDRFFPPRPPAQPEPAVPVSSTPGPP